MARKRKSSRRRVSGISQKGTTDALTTIAGALAGNVAANMLGSSLLPEMSGTTKGAILLAGGIALNMSVKEPIVQAIGIGVALNGGTTLLGQDGLKVISGMGRVGRMGRMGRLGRIGRDGRYITDGIARGRRMAAPRNSGDMLQQGVIAGVPKTAQSDYNGKDDYDGSNDYR